MLEQSEAWRLGRLQITLTKLKTLVVQDPMMKMGEVISRMVVGHLEAFELSCSEGLAHITSDSIDLLVPWVSGLRAE